MELAPLTKESGRTQAQKTPAGMAMTMALSPLPAERREEVPQVPAPGQGMDKWYNGGGSPLWPSGRAHQGAPVGRLMSLDVPKAHGLERVVALLERAEDIRRVALTLAPDTPEVEAALREQKHATTTDGPWTVRIRNAETDGPSACPPSPAGRQRVQVELLFEAKANWGDAVHDSNLIRTLPVLVAAMERQVAGLGPQQREDVGGLLMSLRQRELFLRDFGFVAPLPELNDSKSRLFTAGQYKDCHQDFKSEVEGRPMALAFIPSLGTCLVPVEFTDTYLEARADAVALAWALMNPDTPPSDRTVDMMGRHVVAMAFHAAEREAGRIGLLDLQERYAEAAEAILCRPHGL